MNKYTLCYLINNNKICLAMKKRGFGSNRWNGYGGRFEKNLDKNIRQTAIREIFEEIGVKVEKLEKVAELTFFWKEMSSWNRIVYVYFSKIWQGEPQETEEMKPRWFSTKHIPFKSMWPDDIYWLPKALKGKTLRGKFTFGPKDVILDKKIEII